MTSPESSLDEYVAALNQVIEAVAKARAAVDELREKNRAMHARLAPIGRIIAYQPPSPETDHALAMLSWVVKTGFTTVDLLDRAVMPAGKQLAQLSSTARSLSDIGASLRSIAAPRGNSHNRTFSPPNPQDGHADR